MIKIYDNALPDVISKKLIDLFGKNTEHHEFINYDSCPCFTQLNVNDFYPKYYSSFDTIFVRSI